MSRHLPFDIQLQIIERLPIKSSIRLRSVCKAWNSFISSSEFIAAYNLRHHRWWSEHLLVRYAVGDRQKPDEEVKYVSFVDDDTFPQQNFALAVPPLVQGTTLIGSSHGLLCSTGYFRERDGTSTNKMAVIWNPAIGKSVAVVVPNAVHHPLKSIIGFGVCDATKDPKLIHITYISHYSVLERISRIHCQVMVFALSSGEWRCLPSNQLPRRSIQFDNSSQTVIGRFLYLVAYEMDVDGDARYRKTNLIMSFDLSNDVFREVHLPNCLHRSNLAVAMLWESIVLLQYERNYPTSEQVCSVWMMDDGDSKAFTKVFTINASVERTLGFRKSGEPIIEMQRDVNIDSTSALALYEPCLEEITDLGICGKKCSFLGSSYTESLLLLDYHGGCVIRC